MVGLLLDSCCYWAPCMQVSDVVAGLEWLALNYRAPAVVTMSLGVKVSHLTGQHAQLT